jgi:hypothetical protein
MGMRTPGIWLEFILTTNRVTALDARRLSSVADLRIHVHEFCPGKRHRPRPEGIEP